VLYFVLGRRLAPFEDVYDFFGADMWDDLDLGAEYRHILVPLFVSPFAALVRRLAGTVGVQAALLNAMFGALAVALAFEVFLRLVGQLRAATLLALWYGVSMSQMLFSAVPETYAIGATGIVATYLVCLASLATRRMRFLPWFGVALWTIGITTSNIAQTTVAYAAAARGAADTRRVLRGVALAAAVLATVAALVHTQTRVLDTEPLLTMSAVRDEMADFRASVVAQPSDIGEGGVPYPPYSEVRTATNLASNFFLLGFVGGAPGRMARDEDRIKIEYIGHPLRFAPLGAVAAALWLILWGTGLVANVRAAWRRRDWPPPVFLAALGVIVAGNLLLFTLYNPVEMYLYTLLTAFPILLLGVNGELLRKPRWAVLLAVLVLLAALNNVNVITTMVVDRG